MRELWRDRYRSVLETTQNPERARCAEGQKKERQKTANPREGWEDGTPKERKERKKTDNPNEGWGRRTGSTPARAGFWKDDQGHRWGSPAPDKGHDRLAARCTVDSQLHWRSHLSLATFLRLLTGSLSLPRAH